MTRHLLVLLLAILALPGRAAQEIPERTPADAGPRAAAPQPSSQLIVNGAVAGFEVPPRAGDICVVCKRRIGTEGVVYLVKGQRIPLHVLACYESFLKNPSSYLAALQPHGAFLGAGGEAQELALGWFWAGLYILAGLAFGALCAHRALNTGRHPAVWFGAGLALNLLGYLWLLTRPARLHPEPGRVHEGLGKIPDTVAPQPCPHCGRLNHPAATECADCGVKLQPNVTSEVAKAGLRPS